jgi:ABC-type multidrug transport system fused ATPase/permease subunit
MSGYWRGVGFMYRYPLRHKRAMVVAQLTMLTALLLAIAIPLIMRYAIDVGVLGGEPRLLLVSALVVLGLGAVSVTLLHIGKRFRFKVAGRSVSAIRLDLFRRILELGPHSIDAATGGRALTRLTSDATAVRGVANGGLFELANQILTGIAMVTVCLFIDWRITLLAVAPLVPSSLAIVGVQARLQRMFAEIRGHFSSLLTGVAETLANINVVKSFGREHQESARIGDRNIVLAERRRQMRMAYSVWNATINIVGALPTPIAVFLGAGAVLSGTITVGGLVALVAVIMMLQMNVHMVTMDANSVFRTRILGQRLLQVFDAPPALAPQTKPGKQIELTGSIEARDIVLEVDGDTILGGVNLDIRAGEFVAVVGPTGGGKSTLLHVLARLRDSTSGSVTLDGEDIKELDIGCLRRQVLCLPQRQWVFEGTLADNIRFARPDATATEVANAATAAGLAQMPLDRQLAAGAPDLSAGERQRVGLARALLVDPRILMLDNPTANLDASTEARLLDTIVSQRKGRTLVVATQQPAVARRADRVLVLTDGTFDVPLVGAVEAAVEAAVEGGQR